MNSNNDRNNSKNNFLTRDFAFPTWLLILLAGLLILVVIFGFTIPSFVLILIAIVLILIGLIPSQGNTLMGNSVELSDPDAPEYKIFLSNVPNGVTPKLLKIVDRERSKNYDYDGVGKILFIAGDLVFYKDDEEINSFSLPITLTFNYTKKDEAALLARGQRLIKSKEVDNIEVVKFIPIFLYSKDEKPEIKIWKPFQNYILDRHNKTVTIEFMFWGDQQFGGGTRP